MSGEIRAADFIGQPDAERLKINKWVEEKTRDKIKDLPPAGSVNAMTRLLLVNAIYFKGDWLHAFDPKQTTDAPFHISPEKSMQVPMMRLKKTRFSTGENKFFQTLELPYEGEDISMLLILPKPGRQAEPLENALQIEMRKTDVNVFLPL